MPKRLIKISTSVIFKDGIAEGPAVGAMEGSAHGPIKTSRKCAIAPEYGGLP